MMFPLPMGPGLLFRFRMLFLPKRPGLSDVVQNYASHAIQLLFIWLGEPQKNGQSWDFEGSPYSLSVLKRPGLSRSSCMLFLAIQDDTFMPWSLYFIDIFIFGGLACRGR